MATTMHRLQISLPEWQVQYLTDQARRDGVSMAEVVRRLVSREAESAPRAQDVSTLWDIAGIAEDHGPLIGGIPVSERPELYLDAQSADASAAGTAKRPNRPSSSAR